MGCGGPSSKYKMDSAITTTTCEPTEFDTRSDLTLLVGQHRQPFFVCSRALARASKVFSAMLFGHWKESNPGSYSEWMVALPEDNAKHLKLALHWVHLNLSVIPDEISLEDLYGIMVICDKYDMAGLFKLWAPKWFPYEDMKPEEWPEDKAMLLAAAMELGTEDLCNSIADTLLFKCCVDVSGKLQQSEKGLPLDSSRYLKLNNNLLGRSPSHPPCSPSSSYSRWRAGEYTRMLIIFYREVGRSSDSG
jgi:hypothetical protein